MSRIRAWNLITVITCVIAIGIGLGGCSSGRQALGPFPDQNPSPPGRSGPDSTLRLARATRQAGDLPSSIQLYRTIVAGRSAPSAIVLEFADVLLQAGAADEAIDTYSQINPQSPDRLAAQLGLVRSYVSLNDLDKAMEHADEAQRLAPSDPRVLVDRGVVLDSLGRHVEAEQSYRAALEAAPRRISARNNLALSLALTGRFAEAIALIAPLGQSSNATPQLRENMAVIYALMGDADHAAALSRVDLDEGDTRANLAFLASVRGAGR